MDSFKLYRLKSILMMPDHEFQHGGFIIKYHRALFLLLYVLKNLNLQVNYSYCSNDTLSLLHTIMYIKIRNIRRIKQ